MLCYTKFLLPFCCGLLLSAPIPVFSQGTNPTGEETQVIQQGRKYIDFNIRALDRYSHRIEQQQQLFLNRLQKKEQHFARQLKHKDSVAYARYQQNRLSYDSIRHLLHPDSATLVASTRNKINKAVDSLRGVQTFIQGTAAKAGINNPELSKYSSELSSLQQQLNYRDYITGLIDQHTRELKNIGRTSNIPALTCIDQQAAYYKGRINAWKEIANEPSRIEAKALEYLQGTSGFDQALTKATTAPNSMQAGMDGDALTAAGFQTKTSINKALQQQFGNNTSQLQQQVSGQIQQWQDKAQPLISDIKQAKQTAQQLKQIRKPSLHLNPMRGRPFKLRLEKQYGFQTLRATNDKPALLVLSASIGYKQTTKFSYGIGAIGNIGLGKNWSNIHFSFEGVGVQAYTRLKWQYGIAAYSAYERTWKENVFTGKTNDPPEFTTSIHNTANWSEAVVVGIEKQYKISFKYNGAIQLLYDVWWHEKKLSTPYILRFSTITIK